MIDFLFTYYDQRPSHLMRWHPGFGVVLEDADEYLAYRGYHRIHEGVTADPAFLQDRRNTIARIVRLLSATASRPASLSCFGLHEWAMVYKTEHIRHSQVPLRLGRDGTDTVVESLPLRCTHFDAFRFFTKAAEPRNAIRLSRSSQADHEQPGCLHAAMDLYRHCYSLTPLIDSGLTLACFELAFNARELDMRASPYDLTDYGYTPIRIETPSGRAEYVRAQSAIAQRAADLRADLLSPLSALGVDPETGACHDRTSGD